MKKLSHIDLEGNHALADISALITLAHEADKPFEEIKPSTHGSALSS